MPLEVENHKPQTSSTSKTAEKTLPSSSKLFRFYADVYLIYIPMMKRNYFLRKGKQTCASNFGRYIFFSLFKQQQQ